MEFKKANDIILRQGSERVAVGKWDKPKVCPHCGAIIEAEVKAYASVGYCDGGRVYIVSLKCPGCEELFVPVYTTGKGVDGMAFQQLLPLPKDDALASELETISEGFARYHRQAFRAELSGDMELAAVGYRSALEHLLKDFAIKEMNEDEAEVRKMFLGDIVKKYEDDTYVTARVVQVIGNDKTHYEQKHPEVPFKEFKFYYRHCLSCVLQRYKINHPPVS